MTDTTGTRTDETRLIEEFLRLDGFEHVEAYRYNSASIRVRVIDLLFEFVTVPDLRYRAIEAVLDTLPERTQADIISIYAFAPSELKKVGQPTPAQIRNDEFEAAMP